MATKKQIAANRLNAQKSTGPRTPEGKARSSRNAITHGLCSRDIIVPGESHESFEALHQGFRDSFHPVDAFEESLVFQMAIAQWRTYRLVRGESALLWRRINSHSSPDDLEHSGNLDLFPPTDDHELSNYRLGKAFGDLSGATDRFTQIARFESCLRRSFYQAYQVLEARRQARLKEAKEAESGTPERFPPASAGIKTENRKRNPISRQAQPKQSITDETADPEASQATVEHPTPASEHAGSQWKTYQPE